MENKLLELINTLVVKNLNNETLWQKTSGENEFKIQLNKATLTIDKWEDEDGINFSLEIYNADGQRIQTIHTMETHEEDCENFEILSNLYQSVIQAVYKIDETIDSILNELKSDKIIGKI